MTGLQRWRKVARGLIIFSFGWEAAVAIVRLVLLVLVVAQGGALSADRLMPILETFGTFGVVMLAIRDARRRRRQQPPRRGAPEEEDA